MRDANAENWKQYRIESGPWAQGPEIEERQRLFAALAGLAPNESYFVVREFVGGRACGDVLRIPARDLFLIQSTEEQMAERLMQSS